MAQSGMDWAEITLGSDRSAHRTGSPPIGRRFPSGLGALGAAHGGAACGVGCGFGGSDVYSRAFFATLSAIDLSIGSQACHADATAPAEAPDASFLARWGTWPRCRRSR